MGDVIIVDFEKKQKVETYNLVHWSCVVCNEKFEYDSRKGDNPKRVILRDSSAKKDQECICKDCAKDISNIVEEHNW